MKDIVKARLAELETQLGQQITRRTQLEQALKDTITNVERLEGACAFARGLLQDATPTLTPVPGNGSAADDAAMAAVAARE
jgi:hypothetical protein